MFENFEDAQPDEIMRVAQKFAADQRAEKIDLGVGVYKDDTGETIVLPTVKKVEAHLVEAQRTKSYVGLTGDAKFNVLMADLILGEAYDPDRTALVQTPGGSSALRLLCEAIKRGNPDAKVWVPDPTWGNHVPILVKVGLGQGVYPYYDADKGGVDFDAMLDTLQSIPAGDAVLLHGCCHNPTGANMAPDQWNQIAKILLERSILPFIDIAYQGFGDGLNEDAYGARKLYEMLPELVIAASCSKNFAIYRERTGIAIVKSADANVTNRTRATLSHLARVNHSMPPDHGAAVVREILGNEARRAEWQAEVVAMRTRVSSLRTKLAKALRDATGSSRFDGLKNQRGMFSLLGLTRDQVEKLRDEYAIYMIEDSRINVAGLNDKSIPIFANAVAKVLGA